MNRHSSPGYWPRSSVIPDIFPPFLLLVVRNQLGGVPQGSGHTQRSSWKVKGSKYALKTPQASWRAASAEGRSCPELAVLARAMEINTFVTNPNIHANRSCSPLKCKLLGSRWRKWEERKLEVSAPGCTGVTNHNYEWVMSRLLPAHHKALSGVASPQPSRAAKKLGGKSCLPEDSLVANLWLREAEAILLHYFQLSWSPQGK